MVVWGFFFGLIWVLFWVFGLFFVCFVLVLVWLAVYKPSWRQASKLQVFRILAGKIGLAIIATDGAHSEMSKIKLHPWGLSFVYNVFEQKDNRVRGDNTGEFLMWLIFACCGRQWEKISVMFSQPKIALRFGVCYCFPPHQCGSWIKTGIEFSFDELPLFALGFATDQPPRSSFLF